MNQCFTYGFKVDHLGSHKLRGAKQDLELLEGLEPARQPKVDYFDPIAGFGQTEDVLRLKINNNSLHFFEVD
jgi:hypothetical protein